MSLGDLKSARTFGSQRLPTRPGAGKALLDGLERLWVMQDVRICDHVCWQRGSGRSAKRRTLAKKIFPAIMDCQLVYNTCSRAA